MQEKMASKEEGEIIDEHELFSVVKQEPVEIIDENTDVHGGWGTK